MITYAIDWGDHTDGKLWVYNEEASMPYGKPLYDFIVEHAPCRIIIESTFESYFRKEKNRCIRKALELGVEILTNHPRNTELYRRTHGLKKGTDEDDAKVIWAIWKEGVKHLSKPREVTERAETRSDAVEALRRMGWPAAESEEFAKYLPREIPEVAKPLCEATGRKFAIRTTLPLVAAALDVLDLGGTRKDFDKRVGAYGCGFGSILRANFYHQRIDPIARRSQNKKRGLTMAEIAAERKPRMRALRKATRWLFHIVRSQYQPGTTCPATGTTNP